MRHRLNGSVFGLASLALFLLSTVGHAQTSNPQPATPPQATTTTITCSSRIGERQECAADTSKGVVLQKSYGESACLLGKTWGYTDHGVWVSDGCVGDFIVGPTVAQAPETTKKAPTYVPNGGFLIVEHEKGEMYVRLFSYARYLNQKGLDETYTDAFGKVHDRAAARGRATAEVLPAVHRVVPHAEVPLLPLRLVVEYVAGRSGAGGRRRQHQLRLQQVRDLRRRHHQPARACAAPRGSSRTGSAWTIV